MQPIAFDNSYARLPDRFYARLAPTPVTQPSVIKINEGLARELGIEPTWLASADGIATLAGNRIATGSEPLAAAYAGHQFGGFSPQLGDGRAILLGEVIDRDGRRRDIQLKGSGPTPYSRRGDGRAALGPVIREYLVSEAMHALGIPTTRALAAVTTGDHVFRDDVLPGAILTRVAASHIRVGTFQYFAARGDVDAIRTLADHVIARHYPEVAATPDKYRALFKGIMQRQATLVAQWLGVGFIHGVMNTDNMTVSGETIDYGPCAFMDAFDPAKVYSSIDHGGRYAFANQPRIAQWNLARLIETLLPLLSEDETSAQADAQTLIDGFAGLFNDAFTNVMRAKLGLREREPGDLDLAQDLLKRMEAGGADFTNTFRSLAHVAEGDASAARKAFRDPDLFDEWVGRWQERLSREQDAAGPDLVVRLKAANPAVIPRNHLVEAAIAAAVTSHDYGPFEDLLRVLGHPYDDQPPTSRYSTPPLPEEIVRATFCGT